MIKIKVKSVRESKLLKEWFSEKDFRAMSPEEQQEYLAQHPDSKFQPDGGGSKDTKDDKSKTNKDDKKDSDNQSKTSLKSIDYNEFNKDTKSYLNTVKSMVPNAKVEFEPADDWYNNRFIIKNDDLDLEIYPSKYIDYNSGKEKQGIIIRNGNEWTSSGTRKSKLVKNLDQVKSYIDDYLDKKQEKLQKKLEPKTPRTKKPSRYTTDYLNNNRDEKLQIDGLSKMSKKELGSITGAIESASRDDDIYRDRNGYCTARLVGDNGKLIKFQFNKAGDTDFQSIDGDYFGDIADVIQDFGKRYPNASVNHIEFMDNNKEFIPVKLK